MGFRQCLPLSLTTLRDEHYRHAIAAMGVWSTGSSRLMQISLLRISLLWFFKTITKIWLMRFYRLFIFVTAYIK